MRVLESHLQELYLLAFYKRIIGRNTVSIGPREKVVYVKDNISDLGMI